MIYPPPKMSWMDIFEGLSEEDRAKIWAEIEPEIKNYLEHDWQLIARREQLAPPDPWTIWLYLAGRGSGKTRSGAEWVVERVRRGAQRLAIVAPTAGDARDVLVEGESGIMEISAVGDRPNYEITKRRLTWPNGAQATLYSADEPDRLRGPQHEYAWCDEIAAWRYLKAAWDNLLMGLRLGEAPQIMATTTPRPLPLIKDLVRRAKDGRSVVLSRGSTYDNLKNLAPTIAEEILAQYEGTRIGRQEIEAEILEDADGALWNRELLEQNRVSNYPNLELTLIGVDPNASSSEAADEYGIVVGGNHDGRSFVVEDASGKGGPTVWAKKAVAMYFKHDAHYIVAEKNNGGEMVQLTINSVDATVPVKLVHASKGKLIRAEPIALEYDKGHVQHVGAFPLLEDEMCSWEPGDPSPNRLDAMVWLITELRKIGKPVKRAGTWGRK